MMCRPVLCDILEVMRIAEANPDYDIIQPSIDLNRNGTLFAAIEATRLQLVKEMSAHFFDLVGHAPFFGKGLIRCDTYVKKMLIDNDTLIERVRKVLLLRVLSMLY